jgi:hypothetical protein
MNRPITAVEAQVQGPAIVIYVIDPKPTFPHPAAANPRFPNLLSNPQKM